MTRSADEQIETNHEKARSVGFESGVPGGEHLISTGKQSD